MELKNKMCCMLGGLGEKRFGGRYRQGNRVFSSNGISSTVISSPVGNIGGYSSLYIVKDYRTNKDE